MCVCVCVYVSFCIYVFVYEDLSEITGKFNLENIVSIECREKFISYL